MEEISGFGLVLLDQIFEAGRLEDGVDPSIISTVLFTLNVVCTLVICVVLLVRSMTTILNIASTKNAEADGMSLTWAPLHLVISILLVAPMTPSGYSPGQYFAIWVAEQGSWVADLAVDRTLDYLEAGGTITAPPMPSINGLGVALAESEYCRAEVNAMMRHTESLPPWSKNGQSIGRVQPVITQPDDTTFLISYPFISNVPRSHQVTQYRNEDGAPWCGSVGVTVGSLPGQSPNAKPDSNGLAAQALKASGRYESPAMDEATREFNLGAMRAIAEELGKMRSEMERIASEGLAYDVDYFYEQTLDQESQDAVSNAINAEPEQIAKSAAAVLPVLRAARTSVFQTYGSLIQEFEIARDEDGATWIDQLRDQGWPALGMFWVQMVAQNQRLLERAAVATTATGPDWQRIFEVGGDGKRLDVVGARLAEFRMEVQSDLARTGLGSNLDTSGKLQSAQQVKDVMADELNTVFNMARGDGLEPATAGESIKEWLSGVGQKMLTVAVRNMREDEANPITVLVNTGHNLVVISEGFYVLQVLATAGLEKITAEGGGGGGNLATKAINFLFSGTNFIGNVLKQVLEDLAGVWKYVALGAMFAAFYVAVMPFLIYFMAVVGWMIHVVQAVAVVSVWGMLYAFEMGSNSFASQRIQQGYLHLLELFLQPLFIVIGFFIALKIVDISGFFLIDWLLVAVISGAGDNVFGLMSIVAGLVIIAVAIFQIMARVLEASMTLHEKAMSWLGQNSTFGTETDRQSRTTIFGAVSSGGSGVSANARMGEASREHKRMTRTSGGGDDENPASRIGRA